MAAMSRRAPVGKRPITRSDDHRPMCNGSRVVALRLALPASPDPLTGRVRQFLAALPGGFGELGAALPGGFGELGAALPGGLDKFGATLAGGLHQGGALLCRRAGQFPASFGPNLQTVSDFLA